jgi:hypothetical protein
MDVTKLGNQIKKKFMEIQFLKKLQTGQDAFVLEYILTVR